MHSYESKGNIWLTVVPEPTAPKVIPLISFPDPCPLLAVGSRSVPPYHTRTYWRTPLLSALSHDVPPPKEVAARPSMLSVPPVLEIPVKVGCRNAYK